MLQETMKTITDAEAQAAEIVRKAREEADYTVAAARKEATDMIAAAGASAKESMKNAEGNHLHFELRHHDDRMNPIYALGGIGDHEVRNY